MLLSIEQFGRVRVPLAVAVPFGGRAERGRVVRNLLEQCYQGAELQVVG